MRNRWRRKEQFRDRKTYKNVVWWQVKCRLSIQMSLNPNVRLSYTTLILKAYIHIYIDREEREKIISIKEFNFHFFLQFGFRLFRVYYFHLVALQSVSGNVHSQTAGAIVTRPQKFGIKYRDFVNTSRIGWCFAGPWTRRNRYSFGYRWF